MNISIAKPQVEVDKAIKELVQHQTERCTIVHCRIFVKEISYVRIWPSTFLIEDTGRKCQLVKAFNISMSPEWTDHFVVNDFIRFTLVFEGLGKDCHSFEMREIIPAYYYAFYSKEINRNSSDVYFEEVFC